MKQIEFKTSKGEFIIVEYSDIGTHLIVGDKTHVFSKKDNSYFTHIGDSISIKDITEDQANDIVDKVMNGQHFQNYNYKCVTDRWVKSARESLKSLIESLDIHLYKNPIKTFTFDEDYIRHIEAEANTFYNPYIFKIVE